MRPGDFSPGNQAERNGIARLCWSCFNEAGGFLPRKPGSTPAGSKRGKLAASMRPGDFSPGNLSISDFAIWSRSCFNEAGGFLPRKRIKISAWFVSGPKAASMRPGDFSPGNGRPRVTGHRRGRRASMRPGDFSPGNLDRPRRARRGEVWIASMRPGDFSPGNEVALTAIALYGLLQ